MFVKATLNLPTGTPENFMCYSAVVEALSTDVDGLTAAFSYSSINVFSEITLSEYESKTRVSGEAIREGSSAKIYSAFSLTLDFPTSDSVQSRVDQISNLVKQSIEDTDFANEVLDKFRYSLFFQICAT